MKDKLDAVHLLDIYKKTLSEIISSPENWISYLRYHARIHKYPFNAAVLAYAQNPKAIMIASPSIWKKVGRTVNKGAKGIMVFKYVSGKQTTELLFDVTQTSGPALQRPQWEILEEEKDYIFRYIDEERNYDENTLEGKMDRLTADIALTYIRDIQNLIDVSEIDERAFTKFVIQSAQFMVRERSGLQPSLEDMDFSFLEDLKKGKTLLAVGYVMQQTTQNVMRSVAELKKSFKRERNEFNASRIYLQENKRRLSSSEYSNEQQSGGRSSDREIREDGFDLSSRNGSNSVHGTSNERDTPRENAQNGRHDQGKDPQSSGTITTRESGADDGGYSGEDSSFESNSSSSRGNRLERSIVSNSNQLETETEENNETEQIDEQLDLFNDWDSVGEDGEDEQNSVDLAVEEETTAFSISQKEIDDVLVQGSGFENGKYRIVDFYATNPTNEEAVTFLKNEYGTGGWGGPGLLNVAHDSKGITITKGDLVKPDDEITVKWSDAAKRIRELIILDRYLSPQEKLELESYHQKQVENSAKNLTEQAESTNQSSTDEVEEQKISPDNATEEVEVQNYRYDESDNLYPGGEKTKYRNNVAAIRLLKQLESEKREATLEEQKILARYVGWGGLANVFSDNPKWENEQQELKMLLTEKEYREAMESTITAFYTDPAIIERMYRALHQFGFENGKILDPAMGTGNFFSVLPESMQESELTGVELDSITGRIAQKLYPKADIKVQGFETTSFPDNYFDVVIGNIPFNNIKIPDARYDEYKFLIHDYFIAKSLDVVKPGGIVAFITSKGTMDKKNTDVREYIAERSDLLGAIRLPNNAFKAIAGTEVTTDILFLQKRETPRNLEEERPLWIDTVELPNGIEINRYFAENKEMMLGEMEFSGYFNGSSQYDCVLREDQELLPLLDNAIQRIEGTFKAKTDENEYEETTVPSKAYLRAPEGAKNFTYIVHNDELYYVENNQLIPQNFSQKTTERIKGLCGIREALRDVINIQTKPYDPETLKELQKVLNQRYDDFVSKFGYINDRANQKAFMEDDQLPLLLSIENLTEDKTYEKAPIFYKATIRPQEIKTKADSAKEALEMSLNNKMKVDLQYMSKIYGKDPETIIDELGDLIYLNPEKYTGDITTGWEFKDEYLTGNVYDKLQYAKQKAKEHPELFQRNVEALEDVQPPRLGPGDIHFRIGSSWIPKKYYQEFMYELFGTEPYNRIGKYPTIYLDYSEYTNTWKVEGKHAEPTSVKVNSVYGTSRKNAYELFEDCLNLQDTTVRNPETYIDQNGREQVRYVVDPKETMIARSKQQDIQRAFSEWLFKDPERSKELLDIYNNTFNTIRPRTYDGSFLTFPDMNTEMELRPHQKNVVARILSTGTALIAHEVGAGKTAAMIAAGMKLKQIGAIKKPMYVVMNHTIEQWANEFMRFYPNANILVTTKKDFEKKNRQRFVSKIATGEYDAVIIGHSQFEKIRLSKERQESILRKEIATLTYEIKEAKKRDGNDWSVKQLVIFQKKLEDRLKKLQADYKKDDILNFEDLGVDALFVDEAHLYKNLYTVTKLRNVAGIGTSSSQRATDMKMKCEYIQEQNQGRGVVFATGTPVTNSMSELHVMQRFLQPETLKRMGLEFFDKWAGTFGEVTSSLEMTPEGSGYRMKSRFSKFHNLPELMNTFSLVADIQTADMLNLPRPELEGGKAQIIVSPISDYQKRKMDEFVERSEAIRNGMVDPSEDNMLKLTHEAKLMAIDPRLIDEDAPADENSKLSKCANKVYEIWNETKENKSTQIIFCDSGTPRPDKFNVYDEIKRQLMEKGIPEKEIAFIHDAKTEAQRDQLFEKVRNGEVRVILGSTSKVGTGTNIQDRLIAGHHIDCPWRPADLTQRDGRILRQGNMNKKVQIYRYVTKGTFDAYLWQIQEQKNRYISQIMTGKSITRSADDLDETVLTAAEVKAIATDNPFLLEKMTIDNEVNRLRLIRNRWLNEKAAMQRNLEKVYPERLKNYAKQKQAILSDIETVKKHGDQNFKMTIGGNHYFDAKEAGVALRELINKQAINEGNMVPVGTYKGLEVYVTRTVLDEIRIGLKGQKSYECKFLKDEKGNILRLTKLVETFPQEIEKIEQKIQSTEQQIRDTENELKQPFIYEDEYQKLLKKQTELNLKMEFSSDIMEQDQGNSKKISHSHKPLQELER